MAGRRHDRDVPDVDGVLLVYHRESAPGYRDASTVWQHIRAFERHSRFPVWPVNSDYGFPRGLVRVRPRAIVLHYSLFGPSYRLDEEFRRFLAESDGYKVAFFQDEFHHCRQRFAFIDEVGIDCVYTLLEPRYFSEVYGRHTGAAQVRFNLPGYVGDELLEAARRLAVPDERRRVDVGYRGRPLPAYMGVEAQEKHRIGLRFAELAAGTDLVVDIDCSERGRLYGDDWHRFLGGCRAVLGVDSGVGLLDVEDEVLDEHVRLREAGVERTPEEWEASSVGRWYRPMAYRMISPRHFEAAAMRVCQVLFEGRYSGAMAPMVHYVPLRKDFSNFDEVVRLVRDPDVRREITDNAHRDLIASGRYGYDRLIEDLDEVLVTAGVRPEPRPGAVAAMDGALRRGSLTRRTRTRGRWAVQETTGRVFRVTTPVMRPIRRLLGRPAGGART